MSLFVSILAAVAMVAVLVVLIRGLLNMMRGGPGSKSNKLMQTRVMLQAVAIALLLAVVFLMQRGG